jgi:hypothetical protein
MSARAGLRTVGRVLAILLVAGTSLAGFYNAFNEMPDAASGWQRAVAWGQIVYAVSGVTATVGLVLRRRWAQWAVWAWTVASAFVGGVASFAFHDPSMALPGTKFSVATAAGAILLVGALVAWVARAGGRPEAAGAAVPPAA